MREFRLPDLGEGLTEAEIVEWLVGVGDAVRVDQPVVEVETAKARVEVPAPFAGVVSGLHGRVGDTVSVGAALLSIDEMAGVQEPAVPPGLQEPGVTSAPSDESGRVLVGYGTGLATRRHRRTRATSIPDGDRPATAAPSGGNRPVISPLVRRLAREHGIDIATLPGSGPHGTVLRRDVQAALSAKAAPDKGGQRIPLTGARRLAAEKFTRSRREIPEATVWVDVDATELLAARAALNAARPDQPVSVLALLARFTVLGLRRFPELNARVDEDAVILLDEVHLGFAAQTDHGLVVPVVRDAHAMTTRQLSAEIAKQLDAARTGSIAPSALTGGTFTVNNYGVFGVDGSAAIINAPEVAILGIGRVIERPWVVNGELAVRKVAELTLAFDHRACDGAVAGGFLRFVADCIESPVTALGDL